MDAARQVMARQPVSLFTNWVKVAVAKMHLQQTDYKLQSVELKHDDTSAFLLSSFKESGSVLLQYSRLG